MVTIAQLLQQLNISVTCLAGKVLIDQKYLPKKFSGISDLVVFFNPIHPECVQVLGEKEDAYFQQTPTLEWQKTLIKMSAAGMPLLIATKNFHTSPEFIDFCENQQILLLKTESLDLETIEYLRYFLSKQLAEHTTRHGVFLDVLGMGVLISGESGVGKSELALELISRGHGLIADDAVDFYKIAFNTIEGKCPALLSNLIEVRGLGLLDIKSIFGETAVRRKMNLKLIVSLTHVSAQGIDRFPLQDEFECILGVNIQKFILPVAPGRNLAVLVEAAVRKAVLQKRGIDTMQDFMQRQAQAIENDQASRL